MLPIMHKYTYQRTHNKPPTQPPTPHRLLTTEQRENAPKICCCRCRLTISALRMSRYVFGVLYAQGSTTHNMRRMISGRPTTHPPPLPYNAHTNTQRHPSSPVVSVHSSVVYPHYIGPLRCQFHTRTHARKQTRANACAAAPPRRQQVDTDDYQALTMNEIE